MPSALGATMLSPSLCSHGSHVAHGASHDEARRWVVQGGWVGRVCWGQWQGDTGYACTHLCAAMCFQGCSVWGGGHVHWGCSVHTGLCVCSGAVRAVGLCVQQGSAHAVRYVSALGQVAVQGDGRPPWAGRAVLGTPLSGASLAPRSGLPQPPVANCNPELQPPRVLVHLKALL